MLVAVEGSQLYVRQLPVEAADGPVVRGACEYL